MSQWINNETFPSSIWNLRSKLFLTKMHQAKTMSIISVVCHCLPWNDTCVHNCMYETRSKRTAFSSGHSHMVYFLVVVKRAGSQTWSSWAPSHWRYYRTLILAATQSSCTLRIHWIAQEGRGTILTDLCKVMHVPLINLNAINKFLGNYNWVGT